jgi:hypothetical protein
MTFRYKHELPSHCASELVYISDSDDSSINEEGIVSEEQNNRRLRQAISYLVTGGGSDTLDLYTDRVQKINDKILQQYAEEEYLFDPKLYRQLRAMVQEVQIESSQMDEDDVDDVDMLENSEDIEEREQEALLREYDNKSIGKSNQEAVARVHSQIRKDGAKAAKAEEDAKAKTYTKMATREKQLAINRAGKAAVGEPRRPFRTSVPKTTQPTVQETVQTVAQKATPSRHDHHAHHGQPQAPVRTGRSAVDKDRNIPREIVWRYGGPKNDPEQYHHKFPASLPFGETLYMQEWESMKIDFDLNASANRKADDSPVITDVNYDNVKLPVGKNPFDSGSRFKLPEEDPKTSKWLKDDKGELLRRAVHNFNQGGNLKAAEGKDYAPRIWLPKIVVGEQKPFPLTRPRDTSLASHGSRDIPPKPSSSDTNSSSSRTAGPSSTQTNPPLVSTSKSILSASFPLHRANQTSAAQKPKSPRQTLTMTGTRTRVQSSSIPGATTTGRRKPQAPIRVDSAHDERAEIYTEYRQAKACVNDKKRQIRSSSNKIDIRRGVNPIVRVQTPKHLPPQSPPRTPVVRQTGSIPPQPAVKRGPGRPRKVLPPPKPTISVPNARVIEKPHPSGTNAAPRGTKRKLSDGSKRFTPEKKVCSNEDDNEEFSANEAVVEKVAVGEEPKSPSHTRSGRRFLPSPVH